MNKNDAESVLQLESMIQTIFEQYRRAAKPYMDRLQEIYARNETARVSWTPESGFSVERLTYEDLHGPQADKP